MLHRLVMMVVDDLPATCSSLRFGGREKRPTRSSSFEFAEWIPLLPTHNGYEEIRLRAQDLIDFTIELQLLLIHFLGSEVGVRPTSGRGRSPPCRLRPGVRDRQLAVALVLNRSLSALPVTEEAPQREGRHSARK